MKFNNSMNSLLTNLIPQKIRSWPKFLAWNSYSKSHVSLSTWSISPNEGSKFNFNYQESNSSYILLIDVTSVKLHLINFVYFFETPGKNAIFRIKGRGDVGCPKIPTHYNHHLPFSNQTRNPTNYNSFCTKFIRESEFVWIFLNILILRLTLRFSRNSNFFHRPFF